MIRTFFKSLYLTARLFVVLGLIVFALVVGFFVPPLVAPAQIALLVLSLLIIIDIMLLYSVRKGVAARRDTPQRFSNGDDNSVFLALENFYTFPAALGIIDEIPHQFQRRDVLFRLSLAARTQKTISYTLHPTKRGEYHFGALNVYASSPIGLVSRRFRTAQDELVPVYPSYLQMRKYELLAISNRLTESGIKKIRRIGNAREFEQIKNYVKGDDFRNINWKATARRTTSAAPGATTIMVNQYQDERSQQVYSLIDMGRAMKMPFEKMSLVDYAINSSLVISNIALRKSDRAGIITFSDRIGTVLAAERKASQISKILETLYNQETSFKEPDYEALYIAVKRRIPQRSLLLLYTNFETLSSMKRHLPFLRKMARNHLLVTVFFLNTELDALLTTPPLDVEGIYIQTIAEKFAFEKKEIVRELTRSGIQSILTTPKQLSVNTINKYLELKARGLI